MVLGLSLGFRVWAFGMKMSALGIRILCLGCCLLNLKGSSFGRPLVERITLVDFRILRNSTVNIGCSFSVSAFPGPCRVFRNTERLWGGRCERAKSACGL